MSGAPGREIVWVRRDHHSSSGPRSRSLLEDWYPGHTSLLRSLRSRFPVVREEGCPEPLSRPDPSRSPSNTHLSDLKWCTDKPEGPKPDPRRSKS